MNASQFIETNSLLIAITCFSVLRTVFMLAPHLVNSTRLDSSPQRNKWWSVHKRILIVHYIVLAPLFEVLVIWGSKVFGADVVTPVALEVLIAWLSIVILCVILLLVACCTRNAYRMMVHCAQLMELLCMLMFFSDRCVNTRVAGEIVILIVLIACNTVEIFTVPDFFVNYFPRNEPAQKLSEQELQQFNKTITDFGGVDDANQSHAMLERSVNDRIESLFEMIATADPKTMTISDMRDFISLCQRNVGDILHSHAVSCEISPRGYLASPVVEHATATQNITVYLTSEDLYSSSASNSTRRKNASNEKPEC